MDRHESSRTARLALVAAKAALLFALHLEPDTPRTAQQISPPCSYSPAMLPKFVSLEYVMNELSISKAQAYALVRSGKLRAIQVGGRGQWRVSLEALEDYIRQAYLDVDEGRE